MILCSLCNVHKANPHSGSGKCTKCSRLFTDENVPQMCWLCGDRLADKGSEVELCAKCHFDLTEEVLP